MGFTAVDGLMMGTRCGALDPGVLLYLMQEHRMDAAATRIDLSEVGLVGVPAYRRICAPRASSDPRAGEAIAPSSTGLSAKLGR
jgi:acetate kinase